MRSKVMLSKGNNLVLTTIVPGYLRKWELSTVIVVRRDPELNTKISKFSQLVFNRITFEMLCVSFN